MLLVLNPGINNMPFGANSMNDFEIGLYIGQLAKAICWVGNAIIWSAIIRAMFNK